MKDNTLRLEDFQLDTISKKALKTIKGGDEEPPVDPNDPKKVGGGGNT